MQISIEHAGEAREIVANLMQLYLHDMSEYADDEVAPDGRFTYRYFEHYWREPSRHPFLVRVDETPAGFALVTTIPRGSSRKVGQPGRTGRAAQSKSSRLPDCQSVRTNIC
jgi:hypothetical protein